MNIERRSPAQQRGVGDQKKQLFKILGTGSNHLLEEEGTDTRTSNPPRKKL